METTLDPKGRLTLPREVRRAMDLKAGTKFDVHVEEDRVSLLPRRVEGKGLVREKGVLVFDGEPTENLGEALHRFRQERR